MLSVYYGTNTHEVREAALQFAHSLEQEIINLTAGDYQPGQLAESIASHSLFAGSHTYILDNPNQNEDFQTELMNFLADLNDSQNSYIVIDGALLAARLKPYKKVTDNVFEYKKLAEGSFNIFMLAEALLQKDKKNLWLLLQKAKMAGLSEEEIIGTLWWQLKTILLTTKTKSAAEAGVKDYPYNKAKRALDKYSVDRIRELAHSLILIYHQGHSGELTLELALEKWILRV